jgi:hypothetical protein
MESKNFIFMGGQGKKTTLDNAYFKHINNIIETLDEEKELRWETYNTIVEELINQGKGEYFEEIKYRFTDGENPNQVMLDIIEKEIDEVNGLIWFLKRRLEEYLEDDYLRRFYE